MASLRNTETDGGPVRGPRPPTGDDALLDAARAAILAVGWRRTTLTDVARRAGVSRMTIYRRWPDMQTLLADLMTREWSSLVEAAALGGPGSGSPGRRSPDVRQPDSDGTARQRVADGVAATVRALRANALFAKIVEVDPELLLPYLLDRRGRTQDAILGLLESAVAEGQADGSIRAGDARLLTRTIMLTAHGFALSAPTMTLPDVDGNPGPAVDALDTELADLVERYLRP